MRIGNFVRLLVAVAVIWTSAQLVDVSADPNAFVVYSLFIVAVLFSSIMRTNKERKGI
nr:hypothetical protein [Kibdelosporangium sp. MJ126-NF4]CEL16275.1 hypothetical protein [Kibdelosporangium sp. MJ126-NF4]CTQ94199.1 hypothetical protein [Kibdelosporangium sp. MJ126-NF4]